MSEPIMSELEHALAQVKKLQAFKDWVHAYLDSHKVPHHPPGTHGAAGCRIGDRMDWLMDQLAREHERVKKQAAELHVWRQGDPTGDLVQANRDQLLKRHEEAVRRIKRRAESLKSARHQLGYEQIRESLIVGNVAPMMILVDESRKAADGVLAILNALSLYHPMYTESWPGWPEGSEP